MSGEYEVEADIPYERVEPSFSPIGGMCNEEGRFERRLSELRDDWDSSVDGVGMLRCLPLSSES